MKTNTIKIAAILLASTALVAGCGKKKVEELPPAAEGTNYGPPPAAPIVEANPIVPGSQEDFLQQVGQFGDRILLKPIVSMWMPKIRRRCSVRRSGSPVIPTPASPWKAMPTNAEHATTTSRSANAAPMLPKIT